MKHKPLIALLTNNDDDVYCFRKELIEAIIANGYEMLISCPDGPKFELMNYLEFIHDKPEIDRRGTNPAKDLQLTAHYRRLFREYKPDVVLTYTAKPNVYGSIAAHSLGIPVINNVTGFGSVLNIHGPKRVLINTLFKYAYRRSSCIMFQNATNMQLAKEMGMVRGLSQLIPGSGVDTDRYPLQPYPQGGDGMTGDPVVFNYIGRILRDKGVNDYLELALRIKAQYPQTEFNLLGFIEPTEADYYEPLLADLQSKGIINYRGSQKDVKPFIARAHAIIHPSTYGEGMSNVLLENASSGRFLITTDNPGCQETVNNGISGFIYPGGNVDALEKAVVDFLKMPNDKRREMGENGRNHVKTYFSRSIVINAYLTQIQSLTK